MRGTGKFVYRSICATIILVLLHTSNLFAGPFSIDDLKALAEQNCEGIASMDLKFITEQIAEGDNLGERPPISWTSTRIIFDLSKERFYEYTQRRNTPTSDIEASETANDGKFETQLIREINQGNVGERAAALRGRIPPLTQAVQCPPMPGGRGLDDASLLSFLKYGLVRSEMEQVRDRKCVVVDCSFNGQRFATVWLDPNCNALPLKRVIYNKTGGPGSVAECGDPFKVVDRQGREVWMAGSIESRINFKRYSVIVRTKVDRNSCILNPDLSQEQFRVQFPRGTKVTDQVAQISYVMTEGPAGPSTNASTQAAQDIDQRSGMQSRPNSPSMSGYSRYWTFVCGLVLLGVGGALLWRLRHRPKEITQHG